MDLQYQRSVHHVEYYQADHKLYQQADELLYPETVVTDLPLYGNQFIPLGIQTTLQERVRIAALFDSYCNGGSIAHINIDKPFTSFEQAWELTNYIADQGLTYFAFNTKIQACKHNHAFYGDKCPVCGELYCFREIGMGKCKGDFILFCIGSGISQSSFDFMPSGLF